LGARLGRVVIRISGEWIVYRYEHMLFTRQIKVQSFLNWIRRHGATA
jgi:hypothetical protein